jgi:predicted PurR-regulated permease PerM
MDLPYVILLGVWMALFDVIPIIGASIGALPAIIVAFAVGGTTDGFILMTFLFLYQQLENGFLQPKIMGRIINLPAIVVFVAVLTGIQVMGIIGAVLAVPLAGVLQILYQEYVRESQEHIDLPPLAPHKPPGPPDVDQ